MDNRILDIFMVLFSVQIVKTYLDIWDNYNHQKKTLLLNYIVWGIYVLFQYWVMLSSASHPLFVLIANISLIYLIFRIKYHGDNKVLIFRAGMLYVIWMLVEVATNYILGKTGITELDYGFVVGSVISKIIMYILMQGLKYYKKNDFMPRISFGYWMRIVFVPITTVYIIHNIFFLTYRSQRNIFFIVTVILLIIF